MAISRPELKEIWTKVMDEKQLYDSACQIDKEEKTFTEKDLKILNGRGCCVGFVLVISECQLHPESEKNQQILRGYQKCRDALNKNEKISKDPDIVAFIKAIITFHRKHLNHVGPLVGLGQFDAASYQMMCDEMEIGDRFILGTEYYEKRDETHAIGVVRLSKDSYLLVDSAKKEDHKDNHKVNYCRSKNNNMGDWIHEALQGSEITCIHHTSAKGHLSEIEVSLKIKKMMKYAVPMSGNKEVLHKALLRICKKLKINPKNTNIFLGESREMKLGSMSVIAFDQYDFLGKIGGSLSQDAKVARQTYKGLCQAFCSLMFLQGINHPIVQAILFHKNSDSKSIPNTLTAGINIINQIALQYHPYALESKFKVDEVERKTLVTEVKDIIDMQKVRKPGVEAVKFQFNPKGLAQCFPKKTGEYYELGLCFEFIENQGRFKQIKKTNEIHAVLLFRENDYYIIFEPNSGVFIEDSIDKVCETFNRASHISWDIQSVILIKPAQIFQHFNVMNQLQDIVNKENAKLISESIYSSDVADERKCDLDKSLGEAKKNRKANGLIRFLQQDNQNFEMTLKESLSEFCSYDEFKIFVKEACRLTWEKGLFFCQQFFTVNKAIILKEMADHNDIIFCADIFNCVPLKDRHQWIIEQCGAFPEMLSYYLFSLMDVDCPQDNANELMMLLKNEAWKFDAKMVVAPNETSLYEYAIERFLFSVADELVKRGVFSNQSDDFLEKILNRIINTCHLGALEEWLKRYPKYINLIKANEKIYLMAKLFAERGNTVMVKKLMGVNVNLNECKQYPMTSEWMVALEPDTLKLLLDAKANPNIQNNEGKTPLHLSRNPGIIRTLLDAKGSFYTKDKHGETPVFTAAKLSAKTSSLNVLKVLLDAKADPNNSDHQDKLPLILWAIKNKSLNLFNLLLASKANVNVEDKDGLTPLMVAINHYEPFYHNLMEWIEPLLESKANVNVVDKNGETPLTLAMRIVDFDEESNQVPKFRPLLLDEEATGEKIVKVLLNAKADIHVKNNKGETPLQLTSHFFAHIHQDWFKSLLDLRDNLDNIEMLINDITDVIIQYNKSKLLDSKENLMTINVGVIQDINLKKAIILYQHCHQHLDTTRSQVSHYMRRRSLYDCQSTFSKIEDEFKMLIDEVFSLVNEKESIISSFGRLFSGEKLLSDLMKEMLIKKYPAFYTEKSLDSLKQDVVAILRKPGANSQ